MQNAVFSNSWMKACTLSLSIFASCSSPQQKASVVARDGSHNTQINGTVSIGSNLSLEGSDKPGFVNIFYIDENNVMEFLGSTKCGSDGKYFFQTKLKNGKGSFLVIPFSNKGQKLDYQAFAARPVNDGDSSASANSNINVNVDSLSTAIAAYVLLTPEPSKITNSTLQSFAESVKKIIGDSQTFTVTQLIQKIESSAKDSVKQTLGIDLTAISGALGPEALVKSAKDSGAILYSKSLAPSPSSSATPTPTSAPSIPGITVSAISGTVSEGGGTATFTVVLNTQPTSDVIITLASSNVAEGTVSPASLTFTTLNWNTAQTVTVTGVNDLAGDGDQIFVIVTSPASSSDGNYDQLNANDVAVTNVDNDTPGVSVTPTSGLVTTEAAGTATFTVVLNTQPTGDVVVGLSSSDTTEGTVSPSSLTFTSLNWNTPQTATVTGANDSIVDGSVSYTIITAAATSTDSNYNGRVISDVSASNSDNDVAGISVSSISGSTTEAGGAATFTVVLDAQPSSNVVIGISSSDTTEGTVSVASLTFTSSNWNTSQTVTVTGVNDSVDDGNVTYTIITAAATSTDANYNGVNAGDVSATNTDDDTAGATVSSISGSVTEAGGTATFTVVLTSEPTADVVIGMSSSNTSEGAVSPTSLTFTSANWNTQQPVTVTGVNDQVDDNDQAFEIVTSSASSSDGSYNNMSVANVSVTNTDDDSAGITVTPTSGLTTSEAGGTANFTIALNSQPTSDVTISLSSSDTTEGTVAPANLTFTSANWNAAQTVTATGVNDASADGNIAYSIVTASASSSDTQYNGLNASDVTLTNSDNDTAGVTVSAMSGTTTEAAGTATFTVVLNTEPSSSVSIALSSSDTTEGTVSPASVTFTTGNWNVAQTVTVTGVNDFVADGNQTYSILTASAVSGDPSYNNLNPADASVTNTDDDTAGVTVSSITGATSETGVSRTFTVVLTSQPTADVTIPLSSSDTSEGSVSPASLTFTSANWNSPQTVTATGVDDNMVDGSINYSIVTGSITSSDANYGGTNPSDVSAVNSDNDTAGITVTPTSLSISSSANGTFSVVLASQPYADVSIALATTNATIAQISSSTNLTFTSLNWSTPQTVTISGSTSGSATVSFSVTSLGDADYQGRSVGGVSVTNTTVAPTPTPTATPSATPTPTSTAGPTSTPTSTAGPTATPTATASGPSKGI